MPLISRTIPVSHILSSNEYNIHPWEPLDFPEELYNSFNTIGLIHPPILRSAANNEYIIVCGNKRINYARLKKCESMVCLVFTDQVTEEEVLNTLLSEQELYKPLSLIEKARFLKIFSEKTPTTPIDKPTPTTTNVATAKCRTSFGLK